MKLPFDYDIGTKNVKKNNNKVLNMSYRRVESNKNIEMLSDNVSMPRKSFHKNR